jgi:hypothetical protein
VARTTSRTLSRPCAGEPPAPVVRSRPSRAALRCPGVPAAVRRNASPLLCCSSQLCGAIVVVSPPGRWCPAPTSTPPWRISTPRSTSWCVTLPTLRVCAVAVEPLLAQAHLVVGSRCPWDGAPSAAPPTCHPINAPAILCGARPHDAPAAAHPTAQRLELAAHPRLQSHHVSAGARGARVHAWSCYQYWLRGRRPRRVAELHSKGTP